MKYIILFALTCTLAFSQTQFDRVIAPGVTITQTELFFAQTLDHFHLKNEQTTWQQRYCVYSDQFDPITGIVFVSIGGESEMKGISPGRGWLVQLAKQYKALVISLEHRFYGVSQPFPQSATVDSFTVQNLKYLTHDQALADAANFIASFKQTNNYKVSIMNPFITVGGSYPGALSAWFRYKYPHLTVGALASSAVVNAINDFWQYDNQIFESTNKSGASCPQNIQAFNTQIETILTAGGANAVALKTQYNASTLSDTEFLFFIPDQLASLVQYGKRTQLCSFFQTGTFTDWNNNFIAYLKTNNVDASVYTQAYLNNPKQTASSDNMRQWQYQFCSQFGWLQTPSTVQGQAMRSNQVNERFFDLQCINAFGDIYLPKPEEVNSYYGGLDLEATNIIFTNGSEDPWQWASLRESKNNMIAIISQCDNCAHGVELGYPTDSDPVQVQETRTAITQNFTKWITEFQKQYAFSYIQQKLKKTE